MTPNFFVVGAPKAGTTSLYHYLDQHPQIYMSPVKEPCYFASELRPENYCAELQPWLDGEMRAFRDFLNGPMDERLFGALVSDWDDYLRLFRNVRGETAVGEASVCYLWSKTAAANIAAQAAGSKIVMILRNPVDRAFSQYLHAVSAGALRKSFRDQIRSSLELHPATFGIFYPFLDFGMYYDQVRRYLDQFPPGDVRIDLYEDYKQEPARVLAGIYSFLNVDSSFRPDRPQKRLEPRIPRFLGASYLLKRSGLWQRARALSPDTARPLLRSMAFRHRDSLSMDPKDRRYLIDYYREDILKLSALLDRDLEPWLRGAGCPAC